MSSLFAVVRRALDRGGLLGVAVAVLYFAVAPDVIVDGDNAELSSLAQLGGAAHPSGYPLCVLWLRAWSWLPVHSPAHAASLATAMLGVASVIVIRAAAIAWGARRASASLAAAIFATAPIVLHVTTEAEVFALNDLVVALVVWLAAAGGPVQGMRRAVLLAVVAGLGLCDHLTCVLVAPIGLLGVVRGIREADRRGVAIAAAAGAFALGLVPYAYLLIAPDSPASWGTVRGLGELIARITRRDYGGIAAFSATGHGNADVARDLSQLASSLARGWLWLPLAIGLVALVVRCVRRAPEHAEPRTGWWMLALSFALAGPWLASRFDLPDLPVTALMCQRFHLLPLLLLVPAVAFGFDRIGELASRAVDLPLWIAEVAALVAIAVLGAVALPHAAALDSPAVENGVVNLVRSLPKDAVVLVASDEQNFGATYVQDVLGIRPDVVVLAVPMLSFPWYRDRIAARGVAISAGEPMLAVVGRLLQARRPVFADILFGSVLETFPSYPYGEVFRIAAPSDEPPSLDDVVAQNRALLAQFEHDEPLPGPNDGYPTIAHNRLLRGWLVLEQDLREAGRADEAAELDAIAKSVAPRD